MILMDRGHIIRRGTLAQLTGDDRQGTPYSIRPVGEATELLAWLAGSRDWTGATRQSDGSVHATCLAVGDKDTAAALRDLCEGNDVLEVTRRIANLEQTFVNILQENNHE